VPIGTKTKVLPRDVNSGHTGRTRLIPTDTQPPQRSRKGTLETNRTGMTVSPVLGEPNLSPRLPNLTPFTSWPKTTADYPLQGAIMMTIPGTRSRTGKVALGAGGTLLASAIVAIPALPSMAAEPPAPGHEIISFPQRDFVSATGYVRASTPTSRIRTTCRSPSSLPSSPRTIQRPPGSTGSWGQPPGRQVLVHATGTADIQPEDKIRVFQEAEGQPRRVTST